jgi:hypothetical protein
MIWQESTLSSSLDPPFALLYRQARLLQTTVFAMLLTCCLTGAIFELSPHGLRLSRCASLFVVILMTSQKNTFAQVLTLNQGVRDPRRALPLSDFKLAVKEVRTLFRGHHIVTS